MFKYSVKINPDASVYNIREMEIMFPNLGEVLIQSKIFQDLDECTDKLNSFLSILSHLECQYSGTNHVVVIKRQPTSVDNETDANLWDESVLSKFFICNSELLKKSEFEYSIMAQVQAIVQESSNYH